MYRHHVCHPCSTAIINVDYSGISPDNLRRLEAFVQNHGYLVAVGPHDPGGYWDCEACENTEIGHGHVLEEMSVGAVNKLPDWKPPTPPITL